MDELQELGLLCPVNFKAATQGRDDRIKKVQNVQATPEWLEALLDLWEYSQEECTECISYFCTQYGGHSDQAYRDACETVVRHACFGFLLRCSASDSLGNYFYTWEILYEYRGGVKPDINYTVYLDYLMTMVRLPEFTKVHLEPLVEFIVLCGPVSGLSKYKLIREIREAELKADMGRLFITQTALSHYTVLCMQLIKFDESTLVSIFDRAVQEPNKNIAADVYDFFLTVPFLKSRAESELLGKESVKTLDNPQNIHMVTVNLEKWVDSYLTCEHPEEGVDRLKQLCKFWETSLASPELQKVHESLERIELDNTVYVSSKNKLCMLDILHRVCAKVFGHVHQDALVSRLLEELLDMSDTCTSGHVLRLVNVFSGFEENSITIDPKVELSTVVLTRVSAYICTLSEETRHALMEAWGEDENVLQTHLYRQVSIIHDELYRDYVDQKLLREDDFSEIYRDVLNKLFISF
jgi:hypothetical protein